MHEKRMIYYLNGKEHHVSNIIAVFVVLVLIYVDGYNILN